MQFHSLPVLFSALVFALVALTTAAATFEAATPLSTLAIEPVSTLSTDDDATPTPIPTPTPVDTNATSNIELDTNDRKVILLNECSANLRPRNQLNWSDVVYACERDEGNRGKTLIMVRRDNSYVYECGCRQGLGRYYDHWIRSIWGKMTDDYTSYYCYYRKADKAIYSLGSATKVNDAVECRIKHCDTKTCTFY